MGEEAESGIDASAGDTAALEGDLVYSNSEPEALAGGASEGDSLVNDRACRVGGDSVLCAAGSRPCSCSTPPLKLELSLSSARALPPVGTSSFSSRSSMLLPPSRLAPRER
jgi:hypothetical protein